MPVIAGEREMSDRPAADGERDEIVALEERASPEVVGDFLNYTLLLASGAAAAFIVLVLILIPDRPQRAYTTMALLAVTLSAWALTRRGATRHGLAVMTFGVWLIAAVSVGFTGGVHTPTVVVLPLLVLMAGWLVGMRMAFILAAMSILLLLVAAIIEVLGGLPDYVRISPLMYWIVQAVCVALGAGIISFILRSHRLQMQKLRRLNSENVRQRAALDNAEKLRRNQAMLVHTGRIALVGGWEYELATRRLSWTEAAYRILDVDPSVTPTVEMVLTMYTPETRGTMEAAMRTAIRDGIGFDIETRMTTLGGRTIWVRDMGQPEFEDGRVVRIAGAVQDITGQVQVTDMMQSSLENLRRTLDATGDAIFAYDKNDATGGILFANSRFYQMLGIPSQKIPGLRRIDVAHAIKPLFIDAELEIRRVLEIESMSDPHEDRMILSDGRVIERRSVPIESSGGVARVWSFRDVTAQENAFQALRESEARLNQAQEIGQLGNFDWNVTAGMLAWSDELYRLWGYVPRSVAPQFSLFRNGVHPDDLPRLKELVKRVKAGQKLYEWTHRVLRPDGTIRYVLSRGEAEYQDGVVVRVLGTVQDITERRLAEDDLRAALSEAEAANAAKNEFLSRMSHELRTPLNAILGFGQLLAMPDENPLSETQKQNVGEILHAGEHLLGQVDEVLDLSRVESGRIELHPENVALCAKVESCIGLVRPLAESRGIRIERDCPANARVVADRTRLDQVLLNLLSNAVKFNRQGGSVRLVARQGAGEWRIEVEDEGRGIPQEKIARLFKPFERLESAYDGIEGTGIGLALSKRLVEAMGGSIGLSSTPGKGSRFWFELPAAPADEPGEPARVEDANVARSKLAELPRTARRTVLHIEDNPANLKLMRVILASRPHLELLDAATAEAGLELAQRSPPDLVLVDLNLPGMDGFSALQRLRDMPGLTAVPVIAVTANAMRGDVERGLAAGFSRYLTKPLDVVKLLDAVDDALGQ